MPGTRCAVLFCKNNFYGTKKDPSTEHIKFHRFPVDETIRSKWIEFCGRAISWYPPRGSHVCSAHFRDEDYQQELRFVRLVSHKPKSVLKRESVPSISPEKTERRLKLNVISPEKKIINTLEYALSSKLKAESEEDGNVSQAHESEDSDLNISVKMERDGLVATSPNIVEDDLNINNCTSSGTIEEEVLYLRTMNYNLIQERKHLRTSLEAEIQEKCLLMSKLKRFQEDIEFKNKILRSQLNKLTFLNKQLNLKK